MFNLSELADTGTDYLTKGTELLKTGKAAVDAVSGKTTPPQTAQDVAAAAPVKQPFNWKPLAIGAAILAAIGGVIYFLKK